MPLVSVCAYCFGSSHLATAFASESQAKDPSIVELLHFTMQHASSVRTLQRLSTEQRADLGLTKQETRGLGNPVFKAYQCQLATREHSATGADAGTV